MYCDVRRLVLILFTVASLVLKMGPQLISIIIEFVAEFRSPSRFRELTICTGNLWAYKSLKVLVPSRHSVDGYKMN